MFIFDDIIQYFAVQKTLSKIKRYITGAKLIFGKTYTIPGVNIKLTAAIPPNGKLQVFNSHTEAGAGLNADGSVDYIDVTKNPILSNVILEGPLIKALMEYDGNPYRYFYQYPNTPFPMSVIWNGKRKYFTYNINVGLLALDHTSDYAAFQKMKAASELEKKCNEFVQASQRNAKFIFEISKDFNSYSPQIQQQIRLAVINYNNTIQKFKNSMPPGFYVKSNQISTAQFAKMNGIGFLPVIVWIYIVIVAGVVTLGVYIADKVTEVSKQKNLLDAQYDALQQIREAAELDKQGKLKNGAYDDIKNGATRIIDAAATDLHTAAQADARDRESGGILGQVKQIIVVGGIVWIAKTLLSKN